MENLIKDNNIYIYDGNEHLIGKWFGKDLYAKSYTGTGSNWTEVDNTFDSSKTLIGGFGTWLKNNSYYPFVGLTYAATTGEGGYFYQNLNNSMLYVVNPGTNLKYNFCAFYIKN